jgi:LacI family transcriptional regulator
MSTASPPPARRKKTARFLEIAAAAGVSPTTVDRVLNQRGSVSPATAAKVIAAARRLDIPRILPDTRRGLLRFDIVLPRNDTPYFQRLRQALQRTAQMLDKRVVVQQIIVPEQDEAALLKALQPPRYRRNGLIVTAPDTPTVRAALEEVSAAGIPLVTMSTDLPDSGRCHYAGIDNYRAGRSAGLLLGRLARRPGRVLLLTNRLDYRAHQERTRGCREVLADFPALACAAEPIETHDDPDQCYLAVARALKQPGELVGLYHSGAGSSGIVAALRKFGLAGQIAWIGHEPSDEHRDYLREGILDMVIDQDPDGQALSALQHLLYACGMVETAPPAGHEFRLYCAENIWPQEYLP